MIFWYNSSCSSVCIKLWCLARWIIVHKNKLIQENTYRYTVRFRLQRSENTTELAALWFTDDHVGVLISQLRYNTRHKHNMLLFCLDEVLTLNWENTESEIHFAMRRTSFWSPNTDGKGRKVAIVTRFTYNTRCYGIMDFRSIKTLQALLIVWYHTLCINYNSRSRSGNFWSIKKRCKYSLLFILITHDT
jgi:hypothetical protein